MVFRDEDLQNLKANLHEQKGFTITMRDGTMNALLTRLESAEKFKGLTTIEIQSIVDAMLYTQENTITSDAHVRALKKIKAWRKSAGKETK